LNWGKDRREIWKNSLVLVTYSHPPEITKPGWLAHLLCAVSNKYMAGKKKIITNRTVELVARNGLD
jgi:hypothetical protein